MPKFERKFIKESIQSGQTYSFGQSGKTFTIEKIEKEFGDNIAVTKTSDNKIMNIPIHNLQNAINKGDVILVESKKVSREQIEETVKSIKRLESLTGRKVVFKEAIETWDATGEKQFVKLMNRLTSDITKFGLVGKIQISIDARYVNMEHHYTIKTSGFQIG